MSRIYYFGPELTFSYQAADLVRQRHPPFRSAALVACPTAAAIFSAVLDDSDSAAIVPLFNHIQGDVFDFMRFFLLEQIDQLDLPVAYGLYARQPALGEIARVYTKDTVVPQVSDWLATLPSSIEIISSLEMSTADAARRAAEDPLGAAICSAAAGTAHELTLIAPVASNRPGNFTRFGLFVRPSTWWTPPTPLLEPLEHPIYFNDQLWERITTGRAAFAWPVVLRPESRLHLGYLSFLLTLRKMESPGNRLAVVIDRHLVDDHALNNFWNGLMAIMGARPFEVLVNEPLPAGAIEVRGIEGVRAALAAGRPALLLDPVPGLDGYARMSVRRGNTVSWPVQEPADLATREALARLRHSHFSSRRLAAAGFDWQRGPID